MRLLKFNDENVDIDEDTAIGVDFQAYDVSEPGSRKVAASNEFTIPKTIRNLRILGFPGDPQSLSTIVYSRVKCEYWNQNVKLIHNGTARVIEVIDRISILAYEKSDLWGDLEDYDWPTFQKEFIVWLQENKDLPSATNIYEGDFEDFIAQYIDSTEGVFLPFFISNLGLFDPDGDEDYIENLGSIYLKYNDIVDDENTNGLGGHFCVYTNTIFEFLEDKFGVDFSVNDTDYDYNIFQDSVASKFYIRLGNLSIEEASTGFYFLYDNESVFLPDDTTEDKEDKSVFDFVQVFFQRFNCLIDRIDGLDNSEKYVIRRFDDIKNAPIVDFSGNFYGIPSFQPFLENYNQNNWIKFSSIYEDGDELTNCKKITCKNKNLDSGSSDDSLFDIEEYVPEGYEAGGDTVLDMSPSDTLSEFTFFISEGNISTTVYYMKEGEETFVEVTLKIAQLYSLDDEYNTLAEMAAYPVFYEVKKWLTLYDVEGLVFFARYYIKELNGYFFLNKIESYNPEKSNQPTTLELIKLPD